MNANREEPAGKKALVDTLLAIDSRMPTSSAEGREVAKKVLRRDQRRIRILTWMTIGLFLLTVIGICLAVDFYYIMVAPAMEKCKRDMCKMEVQLLVREPQPSTPDLLEMTARMTAGQGWALFVFQVFVFWGTVALLAVILAAACCTVLLIIATRRATLHQIQASLLALSEQFDTLQRSLHGGHSTGGGQAMQEPSA
ncbi:MAG: hypothetical protein ACLQNE_24125 [Thermoguttaceae bacterium]|jgi:Flp pilus assembly protein TadB